MLANALPAKQCASDAMPTWLLKQNAGALSSFLCRLFNLSLEHGVVPSSFESAYLTPLLKKSRSGSDRSQVVSANLKPNGVIQVARTTGLQTTC